MQQLLFPVLFFVTLPLWAQTGPGGVGTDDGAGTLVLWLDANRVSATDGAPVAGWDDASGWAHHFTAGPGARWSANRVNGQAAFSFNGSSHHFERAYTAGLNPEDYTIFLASRVTASSITKTAIASRNVVSGSGAKTTGYALEATANKNDWSFLTGKANGANFQSLTTAASPGSWAGQTIRFQGSSNTKQLYVSRQTIAQSSGSATTNPVRPTRIGAGRTETTAGDFFQGDIAEVIVFGAALNTTQRVLVKNYLAAKYGYEVNADDYYRQDAAAGGNYDHDVAGIGRTSAADLHTESRGTGSVRINDPTGLDDGEFLFWGHDNAARAITQFTDIPANTDGRMARVWRVSESSNDGATGADVGAVDLTVDLGGVTGYTAGTLRLLVTDATTATFAGATVVGGATDLGNGLYRFSGVTALVNGSRFTFATTNTEASNGPGGVGVCNTTSSLHLWLDAGQLSQEDNAAVTTWADRSGKNKQFTRGTGAVLRHASVNGRAALSFNGSSHYFERPFDAELNTAAYTLFSAARVTPSATYKTVFSSGDGGPVPSYGYTLTSRSDSDAWSFRTGWSMGHWQGSEGASTAGTWAGQVVEYQSGTDGKRLYVNGQGSTAAVGEMPLNTVEATLIGAGTEDGAVDHYFAGELGEVIYYGEALNTTRRILVSNFLAAKYGYALLENDLYRQDDAGNGNYDYDVAGIGRVSSTNLHDDARGSGRLRVRNPRDLGDDEFLLWGHDDRAATFSETSDVPPDVAARFARVWRISEVNATGSSPVDVGAVDMRWDLADLTAVNADDLRLLVDTDGDGTFNEAASAGAVALGDGLFQFTGITRLADGTRFTLATVNADQRALSVEVLSFDARVTPEAAVRLDWRTGTRSDVDYFTIEKSHDAVHWSPVDRVPGGAVSTRIPGYTTTDPRPYRGRSYYRLVQTDLSGSRQFSGIRTVRIAGLPTAALTAYPNPTARYLSLEGDPEELGVLRLFNALGQEVTHQVSHRPSGSGSTVLDMAALPGGIYLVRGRTTAIQVVKR